MDYSHHYLNNNLVFPLWNDRCLEVIDQFFAPDVDICTTFLSGQGPETLRKSVLDTFDLFPSLKIEIDEAMQYGQAHIYKWRAKARHENTLMGIAPTGKEIEFSGVVHGVFNENLITRYHSFSNLPQILKAFETQTQQNHTQVQSKSQSSTSDILLALRRLVRFPLTPREIECLMAWIKGYTIKETAKRMGGLSDRTIQTYRESIKKKFGVYSYQQVLGLIQENGLLLHFI